MASISVIKTKHKGDRYRVIITRKNYKKITKTFSKLEYAEKFADECEKLIEEEKLTDVMECLVANCIVKTSSPKNLIEKIS